MPLASLTPYLCARRAQEAIGFYQAVFGAELVGEIWYDPADGRVGHAELRIGDDHLYIADEYESLGVLSPESRGGSTVSFVLVVEDLDDVWGRAVRHGAIVERDVTIQDGRRSGWLTDPWGHRWNIGQVVAAG